MLTAVLTGFLTYIKRSVSAGQCSLLFVLSAKYVFALSLQADSNKCCYMVIRIHSVIKTLWMEIWVVR